MPASRVTGRRYDHISPVYDWSDRMGPPERKLAAAPAPVSLLLADVQALPSPADSFDTVVDTFVF